METAPPSARKIATSTALANQDFHESSAKTNLLFVTRA
jgi:hypothetical protein